MMPVAVPSQEEVDAFLPAFELPYSLNPELPVNINPVVMTDPLADGDGRVCPGYMGFRRRLQETLEGALPLIAGAGRDFAAAFGRSYADPLYRYQTEDADLLFVTIGSLASETTETVDLLRAGILGRCWRFRPFENSAHAVQRFKVLL
jgi:pyruvate/2-oxoacid:ferredoxin oxidoreductase alpha subunit